MTVVRKKLIEVALPLVAINVASAREKSIRHGHPSTLHLWWARRPLAAARAVIFAQMVDDPSTYVDELRADPIFLKTAESTLKDHLKLWEEARTLADKSKAADLPVVEPGPVPTLDEMLAEEERQRLFSIIEDLVLWENTTNETVLQAARDEIWKSWRRTCFDNADHPRAKELFDPQKLPAFHDPFAGGGALPLEAQRLGLESYASDLNPVAVLINKAMIEIPPKFSGEPPVNPTARRDTGAKLQTWHAAQGLAEDVRYYGQWMRDEAEKRIGHLYPKVEISIEMAKKRPDLKPYVGQALTVIAWLWVRTIPSPNPAIGGAFVPLASTFILSNKAGKEHYAEPIVDGVSYRFAVKVGKSANNDFVKTGTKLSRGANFRCLLTGDPIPETYVKATMLSGKVGSRLIAIVAEGKKGRVYLDPTEEHEQLAANAQPLWAPEEEIAYDPASGATWCVLYGLKRFGDLFTKRQLVALSTFSDLVNMVHDRVRQDAIDAKTLTQVDSPAHFGTATAYADAICTYLGIAISRISSYWSNITTHDTSREKITSVFARQAIPMAWDYMEGNPFSDTSGNFLNSIEASGKSLEQLLPRARGWVEQCDAAQQSISSGKLISTDPPYYDNIGYADLSDFFYVWLRRSLRQFLPGLFATLTVPKTEELIAAPSRHGSKNQAEVFFLEGMTKAMQRLAEQAHPAFPVSIYYAFKQSESKGAKGTSSTGWETFLGAVMRSGFAITGTWPLRTEMAGRALERSGVNNALASSIVLICRPRAADATAATRREFVTVLKTELPTALAHLQRGNIAPVDLAQAAIGPGMAVFTRYAKVLDADGKPLSVRDALALINQTLDEALAEQEGDFDADSRWAITWFEQFGFAEGESGVADLLATAKVTSVEGLKVAGIVTASRGKVRLLKPDELLIEWDPTSDPRLTAWETVHQLIRALTVGELAAAALVAKLGAKAEFARELAYRLYVLCERKKRIAEALSYNGLVQSWPEIMRLSREGVSLGVKTPKKQKEMYEEAEE